MSTSPAPPLPLRIRVPGSTSNLGPGFDLLGVALDLFLEVDVLERLAGPAHELRRAEGQARDWPREGDRNLLFLALDRSLSGEASYAVEARSEIPMARGLGSSGAAIAAGLILGEHLSGGGRSAADLLDPAIEIEGHPDNVAASLLGGGTLCHPGASAHGGALCRGLELSQDIGWALAWPEEGLATERARAALPSSVSLHEAIENPRRLALLLEGLRTGDPELLRAGERDGLHVPYRLPLIPGGAEALRAAREEGAWLATVSGSGTALVALGAVAQAERIAQAMAEVLREKSGSATSRVARPVLGSPRPFAI